MSKTIGLREAKQAFARCIRKVEAEAALARARARMEKGWPIGAGPIDREAAQEHR
jgi:hypothetical protein